MGPERVCRSIHENIRAVYQKAKVRGIPTKELRSLVKISRL